MQATWSPACKARGRSSRCRCECRCSRTQEGCMAPRGLAPTWATPSVYDCSSCRSYCYLTAFLQVPTRLASGCNQLTLRDRFSYSNIIRDVRYTIHVSTDMLNVFLSENFTLTLGRAGNFEERHMIKEYQGRWRAVLRGSGADISRSVSLRLFFLQVSPQYRFTNNHCSRRIMSAPCPSALYDMLFLSLIPYPIISNIMKIL